jgi:hypothetical protein
MCRILLRSGLPLGVGGKQSIINGIHDVMTYTNLSLLTF